MARLIIEFSDAAAVREWALEARNVGLLPVSAGVRPVDSLDGRGRRVAPGDHIVSAARGVQPWVIEPAVLV